MDASRVRARRPRPARAWLFPPPQRPKLNEGTALNCGGDHELTEQRRLADRPEIPRSAADATQFLAPPLATGTALPKPDLHPCVTARGVREPRALTATLALQRRARVRPNVRAKLPAEVCLALPWKDSTNHDLERQSKACRSGSA